MRRRILPRLGPGRRVHVVIAQLRDARDEQYLHLCTACLDKRKRKASRETHWNRSIYTGHYRPPEYYRRPRFWDVGGWRNEHLNNDTNSLSCMDCGWTAKGK